MPEPRKAHRERVRAKRRTRVQEKQYYVTNTERTRVQPRRRSAGRRYAARLGGWALVLIGAVMGGAHVFEHLGAFRLRLGGRTSCSAIRWPGYSGSPAWCSSPA